MNREAGRRQIIAALGRAAEEHGMPNSFSPRELQDYGCCVDYTAIGKWAVDVVERLQLQGWDIKYEGRRFIVIGNAT